METEKVREKRTFSSSKHTVWKKKIADNSKGSKTCDLGNITGEKSRM